MKSGQPPEMFCKKAVLEKFRDIQKKTLELESFFNKLLLRDFIKKSLQYRCFPVLTAKFLKAPILEVVSKSYFFSNLINGLNSWERKRS